MTVTDIAGPSITSTATVSVAENATAVTTVAADNPAGDTQAFTISGGDDQAKFAIDSSTGVLTFVAAPDFETPTASGADNVYEV